MPSVLSLGNTSLYDLRSMFTFDVGLKQTRMLYFRRSFEIRSVVFVIYGRQAYPTAFFSVSLDLLFVFRNERICLS